MAGDFAELDAMKRAAEALGSLDDDALARSLSWLNQWAKKRLASSFMDSTDGPSSTDILPGPEIASAEKAYPNAASLLAAAHCGAEHERVLVIGFWFQVIEGRVDLDSQSLNNELKQQGHAVGNITRAISRLTSQKPQLMIQTRKEGKAKQARKRFQLTQAGIDRVKSMLANYPEED